MIESSMLHLLNVDALALRSSSLRDDNAEDAVLETGLHRVLVDTGRESEGTREAAAGHLANPVARLRLLWLLLLLLGHFGGLAFGALGCVWVGAGHLGLVLDSRLVVVLAFAFGDLALLSLAFDEASWRLAFFVDVMGLTLDGQGLWVGELDVDVLLLDARKLAMQLIGILVLRNVEFWLERAKATGEGRWTKATGASGGADRMVGVFVEESEHGSELALDESWEVGHLACWCGSGWSCFADSVDLWKSIVDSDALHRRVVVSL